MEQVQKRYSKIKEKFPREFILLQGTGCFWKKCLFCDYYEDVSENPFATNKEVIDKITGEFGVLDVINSGSAMELDEETLNYLIKKVKDRKIKELWFEAHWNYRKKLKDFSKKFKDCKVNYRIGIETFNKDLRNFWNKGIPETAEISEIIKYFKSVCLLIGTENQTFETVLNDIYLANKYFDHYMINVFIPNSKNIKSNPELIGRFINEIYPKIKDDPKVEISINNTDLGVG